MSAGRRAVIKSFSRRWLQGRLGYSPAGQATRAVYLYIAALIARTYSFAAMSNVPDHRLADRGGYRGHVGLQLLVCAEPAVVRLGRD